jgi:hypothetical protein
MWVMDACAPRPANFDSYEPILTCDPQHLPTERVAFNQASHARVELVSADKRLEAAMVGYSMLTMLAYVDDAGPFDAFLALKVDGNFITVGLHKGMSRDDIVHELRRCLPLGYEAATREGSLSEVLMVNILRPAENPDPELRFLSTDGGQQFKPMGRNRLRIEGRATRGQSIRSHLELFVEGYRVRLPLGGGDFPITTAKRLRDALPKKYTALIELPMTAGGDVTVTIRRRG